MELDWLTPVSRPPFLVWHLHTAWHIPGPKFIEGEGAFDWWVCRVVRGHHPREGGRDTVLSGIAPSCQTVGSIIELSPPLGKSGHWRWLGVGERQQEARQ
jgi:hypothetical protein